MIAEEALRRQEIFRNLEKHLKPLKEAATKVDAGARVYFFGSAAEGRHTSSSDIDVLILTEADPSRMHLELWKAGIKDPFEIHVQPPARIDLYRRRSRLVEIG